MAVPPPRAHPGVTRDASSSSLSAPQPASGSGSATSTALLACTALRALPALPHPALLAEMTPALILDLKRRYEQLDRLREGINDAAIGDSAPLPPSEDALAPLPAVPFPPTRTVKHSTPPAQTVRSRIVPRPNASGRYSPPEAADADADADAVEDEAQDDSLGGMVHRFNAIHDTSESSKAGADGRRCRICIHGEGELLLVTYPNGKSPVSSTSAKRRKTRPSTLHAWVGLSGHTVRHVRLHRTSSPTDIPLPETPAQPGPDALLSALLVPPHPQRPLGVDELLDRLPHLPALMLSPCAFCGTRMRPPDGLPSQGYGWLAPAVPVPVVDEQAEGEIKEEREMGRWVGWHAGCKG